MSRDSRYASLPVKPTERSPLHSELHWHNTAEWAYVMKVKYYSPVLTQNHRPDVEQGTAQISTITTEGQNYVANVVRVLTSLPRPSMPSSRIVIARGFPLVLPSGPTTLHTSNWR